MPSNYPRVEFSPSHELRRRLEALREELSKKANKSFSMSEIVTGIVEQFFLGVDEREGRRRG